MRTLDSRHAIKVITLLICGFFVSSYANSTEAEQQKSRRIEVYSLSQNYWDTQYGDTLAEIVIHLLPNNPSKRETLKQDIVYLNPDEFIKINPAMLLANKRLWMPGYMKQADLKVNPATTTVESYSWGNIKRPKDNNPQINADEHR
jgi:hypothetical protein